jgi:uncharacterized protein YqjF (DUF2071 family)
VSALDFLEVPARQAATLSVVDHRPWPLPERPWLQGQTWEDLCFLHRRVAADGLRRLVPEPLEIDTFDGDAWLGVTPFRLTHLRLHGLPSVPVLSSFVELNVRTYVTHDDRPGIWFFSLDASSRLAVEAAKQVYRLPYHHARMTCARVGDRVSYASSRDGGAFAFDAAYGPVGEVSPAAPGSLEHFLAERYCLYTLDRGELMRADIHHPPWPLQPGEAEIELDTMAPRGLDLPDEAPLVHYSAQQDVVVWGLERA